MEFHGQLNSFQCVLMVQRSELLYSKDKIKELVDNGVEVQTENLSARNKK